MENSENSQSSKFQVYLDFIKKESNQIILAILPLFFSWYPVLVYNYENKTVQKYCIYSLLNTIYFFIGLFCCWVVSKIPFLGDFLASIIHLITIIGYLGFSAFFIYCYKSQKEIKIGFLENHSNKIQKFM